MMLKALRLEIVKTDNPHPLIQGLIVILGILIALGVSGCLLNFLEVIRLKHLKLSLMARLEKKRKSGKRCCAPLL